MTKGSTSNFLRLLNEANARIAAHEAEQAALRKKVEPDPIRLQRDAERRERFGQLRARPKPKKKTHKVHNVFGHVHVDP